METNSISNMKKGWFIGNFEPSLLKTNNFEVAVKKYMNGDTEKKHVHKISKEITVIAYGLVKMNGRIFKSGDIVILEKNEPTDFECLMDNTLTVVVKIPSVKGDKYFV